MYEEAFELEPKNPVILINWVASLLKLKKIDEAENLLNRALELSEKYHDKRENASIFYNLACAKALKLELNDSIELLKKAIELNDYFIDKAVHDSDFDGIRNFKEFKELVPK